MLRRQGGEAVPHPAAQLLLLGVLGRQDAVVAQALTRRVVHRAGRQAPAAVRRIAQVERHTIEPGQRRAVTEQVGAMPIGPHEGVLEDLFGELAVAGQPEGRPEHERPIPLVERLEHLEVVRLRSRGSGRRRRYGWRQRPWRPCRTFVVVLRARGDIRRGGTSTYKIPLAVRKRFIRASTTVNPGRASGRRSSAAIAGSAGGPRWPRRGAGPAPCGARLVTRSGSESASAAISMSASANASSVSTDSVSVGSMSIPSSTMSGK